MKRKYETVEIDERQKLIGLKTARVVLVFLLACLFAAMIVRLVRTDDLGWEFWALIGSCAVGAVTNRLLGNVEVPKSLLGKPLPTGNSRKDRVARCKNHLLESLIFSLACTAVDGIAIFFFAPDDEPVLPVQWASELNGTTGKLVVVASTFVIMLVVSFVVEYLIVEKIKLKQYNKMLADLDEDD